MGSKGTGLAIGLMIIYAAVAAVLFYIGLTKTEIHDHQGATVVGALLSAAVLIMVVFFFLLSDNRRPLVFILVFIGLVLLPMIAYMIAQAVVGRYIDLEAPGMPSPLPYLLVYIFFLALIFVRMATWAMTFEPEPGIQAISSGDLRQRILALNEEGFPFTVKPGKRDDELIVDWKYADATWFDLMRLSKVAYLSRFTVRLDQSDNTMRVREFQSKFNASGGMGGLSLSYSAQWGAITFYEYRRETIYGIQIENGRPVAKLSYSYTFDIREMRDPLMGLALDNGWTFKAVTLPVKWLTG
ncbi:MAG: hypothetical protein WBA83_02750 [Burkholderiaceae bacterium]